MSDDSNEQLAPEDARGALGVIEQMQRASIRRAGELPRWPVAAGAGFIFLMALVPYFEGTGRAAYIIGVTLAGTAAITIASRRALAYARLSAAGQLLMLAIVAIPVLIVIVGAQYAVNAGPGWLPVVIGGIGAATFTAGMVLLRRYVRASTARRVIGQGEAI